MRTLLKIVLGIVALLLLATGAVYGLSARTLSRRLTVADAVVPIPTDSAALTHGRHLAEAVSGCVSCHRTDFSGQHQDQFPFARFSMANLTRGRGGHGSTLTDAQMITAIRHGVAEGGRPLLLMPSEVYQHLSDADVGAIVAYVRSMPSVDTDHPPFSLGPLGRALLVAGQLKGFIPALEMDHSAQPAPAPPAGATAQYGEYLVSIAGCRSCHGEGLSGGPRPGPPGPPASNITPEGLKAYDEVAFFRALREGTTPSATAIDSSAMPWPVYKNMTDDELRAVWMFLKTVPSKPYGNR